MQKYTFRYLRWNCTFWFRHSRIISAGFRIWIAVKLKWISPFKVLTGKADCILEELLKGEFSVSRI